MYCPSCHAGNDTALPGRCPQCKGRLSQSESPFPPKPLFKGSGNANGKTARMRDKSIIKSK